MNRGSMWMNSESNMDLIVDLANMVNLVWMLVNLRLI